MTMIERIRDLAASRGISPQNMILTFGDGAEGDDELREIIVADCGYVTDSVIEDILDELDDNGTDELED